MTRRRALLTSWLAMVAAAVLAVVVPASRSGMSLSGLALAALALAVLASIPLLLGRGPALAYVEISEPGTRRRRGAFLQQSRAGVPGPIRARAPGRAGTERPVPSRLRSLLSVLCGSVARPAPDHREYQELVVDVSIAFAAAPFSWALSADVAVAFQPVRLSTGRSIGRAWLGVGVGVGVGWMVPEPAR